MSKPAHLLFASAAILVLVAPAAALGRGGAGRPCGKPVAKAAIAAAKLPSDVKDAALHQPYAGIDRLFCFDFTRDGRPDIALTVFSGGTAGDTSWLAFRRVGTTLRLAKFARGYKVGLYRLDDDLATSQPVYLKDDPNCCPKGGFDHARFHWDGSKLARVRAWHDKRRVPQ
jgi:hypothetical protein